MTNPFLHPINGLLFHSRMLYFKKYYLKMQPFDKQLYLNKAYIFCLYYKQCGVILDGLKK